jgi:DNA ligase-1
MSYGGQALSRNLKPFKNKHVQALFQLVPNGLDGELIVGAPNRGHVLNRTQSGIMSIDGVPEFTYWVFDSFTAAGGFGSRISAAADLVASLAYLDSAISVRMVEQVTIFSIEEFYEMERKYLADGYEGIMIRGPHGFYKFGRATHSDQLLWKFKRFTDGEATVVGIREGVMNNNEATRDATGKLVRASHQENKTPNGMVGTILARCHTTNTTIEVSPGRLTHEMRKFYFEHPERFIDTIIKIKWFDYGKLDAPRFCTFQAVRFAEDM